MNMNAFFRIVLTGVVFLCSVLGRGADPSPQQRPAFEAASLKASRQSHDGCSYAPSRLRCTGHALSYLIMKAYSEHSFVVQGLPSWADRSFYDVDAVLERQGSPAVGAEENRTLLNEALQGLLEERFHLRFHHEKQLRQGYRLVAAKGGLKLKPVTDPTERTGYMNRRNRDGVAVEYRNFTMARLANKLSLRLERPVIDATRADGHYDFGTTLKLDERGKGDPALDALGDFGLRLEAGKFQTDIFVIDRLEKPDGN